MARKKKIKNPLEESKLKRIKFFLIPSLKASGIGLIGFGILRWLLDLTFHFKINVDIWHFWGPIILGFLLWLIFLRKRIKLLILPEKHNQDALVHGAFLVPMMILMGISQAYIGSSSMQLKKIDNANQIDPDLYYVCYQIKNVVLDPNSIQGDQFSSVSGRHSTDFNMDAYITAKFVQKTTNGTILWLGKRHHKEISNNSSQTEKQRRWEAHFTDVYEEFVSNHIPNNGYFTRIPTSKHSKNYETVIHKNSRMRSKEHIVLEYSSTFPKTPHGKYLTWFFIVGILGLIIMGIVVTSLKFNSKKLNAYMDGKMVKIEDDVKIREFITFRSELKILPALFWINALFMLWMLFTGANIIYPQSGDLNAVGVSSETLQSGQFWRLFTSMFAHAGILHLMNNMVMLYLLSIYMEPALKKWKFLFVYLTSGVLAGIIALNFISGILVGASGAIFGLVGWLLSQLIFQHISKIKIEVKWILILASFSLLMGFITPGVANSAHLAGLAVGFLLGLFIRPEK